MKLINEAEKIILCATLTLTFRNYVLKIQLVSRSKLSQCFMDLDLESAFD